MKYRIKVVGYYVENPIDPNDAFVVDYHIVQRKGIFFWHTLKDSDGRELRYYEYRDARVLMLYRASADKSRNHNKKVERVVTTFDSNKEKK